MDDARLMGGHQTGDDAPRDAQRAGNRQLRLFFRTVARSEPSTKGIVMYLMPSISPRS